MDANNDIVNILMWVGISTLGIVCSYYGSHYIASGVVYVSNEYFNCNIEHESAQIFIFGSFCLGVASVCFPHIIDSVSNLLIPNMDLTVLYGQIPSNCFVNLSNDDIMSWLRNIKNIDYLFDYQQLNNFKCVSKYYNPIEDSEEYIQQSLLQYAILKKMYASSIVLPKAFFESTALASYFMEKYYYPISEDVLKSNAEALRMYYLTYASTEYRIGDFSALSNYYLDQINMDFTRNEVPFGPEAMLAQNILTQNSLADVQLIDSLGKFGSGSMAGISQLELWLRIDLNDHMYWNCMKGAGIFMDGSNVDINSIKYVHKWMSYHNVIVNDMAWFREILCYAYFDAFEHIVEEVS